MFRFIKPNGVMGINKRNRTLIYPNNQRKHYKLADDKVECKQILHKHGIACAETYAVIHKHSEIKRSWQHCQQYNALAIKPANGCGGDGILILRKKQGQWEGSGKVFADADVKRHIANIITGMYSMRSEDRCLIEACIVPHEFFGSIYKEGVPDFRVITLKGVPIMAMLRMPTSKSNGKANLHQKGVGIGVDMTTGKLTQVYDGCTYSDNHPDNSRCVKGMDVPYWDDLYALSMATAKIFPLGYLGIDIVIDHHLGPQIMEVNVRPGLGIQLVNKMGLQAAINAQPKLNTL
ncbi:sugar-transfer associated ATP-grasp domain-containing protein [Gilvibacter sediminis]|uniref:sugar-transfer associated ATP-grasp domain-containing protein n=1 Tax=Gilvibacter sediminis TaxID=379071 RepID=UPI00234FE5EF|nr:sugar-transfer associated ATP-grasp domain-containing protein [Gilvibacter sediminis]MDC7998121.1 sugar-transfer associated ATP-grasp domain-containing protein [Gilvibacter sediminis]